MLGAVERMMQWNEKKIGSKFFFLIFEGMEELKN